MESNSQDAENKLQELLMASVHKFSLWELDFLADMEELDGNFSQGQIEKIIQIWTEKIGDN